MALLPPRKHNAPEQFQDFHTRIHDFSWMLDWKRLGRPHCHVYVIGPQEKRPIKVGVAVDGHKRLTGIQTGNWNPLFVHRSGWLPDTKTAIALERFVHRTLKKHHLSGEWFDVDAEEAFETVEWAAKSQGWELQTGIPDELVGSVYDEVKARVFDSYFHRSSVQMEVRTAELAAAGVDVKLRSQIQIDYSDDRPVDDRPTREVRSHGW